MACRVISGAERGLRGVCTDGRHGRDGGSRSHKWPGSRRPILPRVAAAAAAAAVWYSGPHEKSECEREGYTKFSVVP